MDDAQKDLFRSLFPQKPTPMTKRAAEKFHPTNIVGQSLTGTAVNAKTGEKRLVKVGIKTLENVMANGVDLCTGPCRCSVEADGHCPKGWPSRTMVMVG